MSAARRPLPGDGGIPARRAIIRWAWRMFRREWRQQLLVLALLTVAVSATIVAASAAYNIAPAQDNATFGSADHFLRYDVSDPTDLNRDLAAAEEWFGTIDVITHRQVQVPGSVEAVEYRGQDPTGQFGGPMLALRDGRYPTAPEDVAVTNGLMDTFSLAIGESFALDGVARTVVGVVEDPSDLGDEFALLAPLSDVAAEQVTLLVGGSAERLSSFRTPSEPSSIEMSSRAGGASALAAVSVLLVAAVALVLISLIAAASFVVVAQRRLRQLGMLAAIGATERHLRLVLVTNGAILSVVASALGGSAGLLCWIALVPSIEPAVGHRIGRFDVPWWLVGASMLLAVVTATAAAWWPARMIARTPIVVALSGRPPKPVAVRHSSALAGLLIAVGVIGLILADPSRLGDASAEPFGDPVHALLIAAGTVTTVAGVLLASPLAIRGLAALAGWLPVAIRLALRDLDRYQSRSGAALAAISLALGISVAVAIGAAAVENSAGKGNLSERHLLIWTRDPAQPEGVSPYFTEDPDDEGFSPYLPRLAADDLANLERQAGQIAAVFDDAVLTGMDLAVNPRLAATPDGRLAVTLARPFEGGYLDIALLFVATPELLEGYGLDFDEVDARTDILTIESGELYFPDAVNMGTGRFGTEAVENIELITPAYSSLPSSFITPDALRQRGWESVRVGWLVESRTPLIDEEIAAARDLAVGTGLLIEARRDQPSLATLRSRATAGGVLVALSVLAMTVGLIRSEAAGDLRTLTATGATSAIRRSVTAVTASALALLGVALGMTGAYLGFAAVYVGDIDVLGTVPVFHMLVIAGGVPLAAALTGWLAAGREPDSLTRPPIE